MMFSIPLHCVCCVFGDPADTDPVMNHFHPEERLRYADIWDGLRRGHHRTGIDPIALDELYHQAMLRLRLGERAIIDATPLDRKQRAMLIERIVAFGAPVYVFVCADGENVAYRQTELIDVRATDLVAVKPLPVEGAAEYLSERFDGITAVGDVHGMLDPLRRAVEWARDRNHYLVLSGDILDYGSTSLEVAEDVYRLVTSGNACLITGNHERKIMRWIDGYRVRLSEGNRVTTMGLMSLSDAARTRWVGRFRGLYQNSRIAQQIGNLTFAHAAVSSHYWANGSFSAMENMAFFGEIDTEKSRPDRPVSSYRWADAIPESQIAVVGHNIRSRSHPIVSTNAQGGRAMFLDTGSGKGGILSSADFRFDQLGNLSLRNFNIY